MVAFGGQDEQSLPIDFVDKVQPWHDLCSHRCQAVENYLERFHRLATVTTY